MDHPITLRKNKNGVWETTVDLPGGIHHYRFLVNDECQDEPKAMLRVANPNGTHDSATHVSDEQQRAA
jgi:1,4-alpha-glucan branching enzyme